MAAIASRQRSLITTDQLLKAGVPDTTISRFARTGRLERLQPQVYLMGGAARTWETDLLAATLSSRGTGSHCSGAFVWDLVEGRQPLEVTLPWNRRSRLKDVRVHHTGCVPRRIVRGGIPVTSPMRALLDSASVLSPEDLADALEVGLLSRLVSIAALEGELARVGKRGRPGAGRLRLVIKGRALGEKPAESLLEAKSSRIFRPAGLPTPDFQFEVWAAGRLIARLDFAFPWCKLAIEIDGWSSRATSRDLQRTNKRQNQLIALGWTVLRFTWLDIVRRPEYVIAQIAAQLLALGA
jgi:hypothetical protein